MAKLKQLATIISGITTDISGVKTDVQTLQTDVGTLQTSVSGLSTDVSGLQTSVSGLSTDVSGLQTSVSGLSTDVSGLQTSVSGLSTDVSGLQTSFNALPKFKLFSGSQTFDSNGKCTITDDFITSNMKAFVNAVYVNASALIFAVSCTTGVLTITAFNSTTGAVYAGNFNINVLCLK